MTFPFLKVTFSDEKVTLFGEKVVFSDEKVTSLRLTCVGLLVFLRYVLTG